jgi:hypothetical protein
MTVAHAYGLAVWETQIWRFKVSPSKKFDKISCQWKKLGMVACTCHCQQWREA